MRDDGMREAGPLIEDVGCRRALAKGGVLWMVLPANHKPVGAEG